MSRRSRYPTQYNVPSQAPSHMTPYFPNGQADTAQFPELQRAHGAGYGGAPPLYVVSTFDARPLQAIDFTTFSGTDGRDTAVTDGSYTSGSIFFTVPLAHVAIIRDWDANIVPEAGDGGGAPILPSGASNFFCAVSFIVDGNFQNQNTGLTTGQFAFGNVFGETYIIAAPGAVVEMRVVAAGSGGASFRQALLSMHGNLLLDKGNVPEFEPGTHHILPVKEMSVEQLELAPSGPQRIEG